MSDWNQTHTGSSSSLHWESRYDWRVNAWRATCRTGSAGWLKSSLRSGHVCGKVHPEEGDCPWISPTCFLIPQAPCRTGGNPTLGSGLYLFTAGSQLHPSIRSPHQLFLSECLKGGSIYILVPWLLYKMFHITKQHLWLLMQFSLQYHTFKGKT